jgi:hypothetical protein
MHTEFPRICQSRPMDKLGHGGTNRLRLAPTVTWRSLEDEVVVLDTAGSVYYSLNHSGAVVLRRLESGAYADELADALVQEYEVTREQAAQDVAAFLAGLKDQSLLVEE